jgi:hypothetical protein
MKAIITGTISDGFNIRSVVPDEQAEDEVVKLLANGTLAEAMHIHNPGNLDSKAKGVDANGTNFVVYGKGIASGFQIYGPFISDDSAEEFGEENRKEDDEWQVLILSNQPTPSSQKF